MTFKQYISESVEFPGRYVFHETHINSAIQILKEGRIKGIYVDNPEASRDLSPEMGEDYGNFVYTSVFSNPKDLGYSGVATNDILFVIDTHKLTTKGIFEPQYENGLYKVPHSIPLSAVVFILIGIEDEDMDEVHQLLSLCVSKDIEAEFSNRRSRESVIRFYQGLK